MRFTREDKALVAAVQGTVVEDSRDVLAQVVILLQECMDTLSWRGCRAGLYEIDAPIESGVEEVKEKERRAIQSGGPDRTATGAIFEACQRLGFHISLRSEVADPRWAYTSQFSQHRWAFLVTGL